ncbi:MAG TPA: hypothetical protein VFK61_06205 [Candidatus Limnocylindria bacterium]|nr:hypothetical protein [Candidatus Limnocylindria bacterium]
MNVSRRLLMWLAAGASAIGGLALMGVGVILRQRRMADAGKRSFHGRAFERRWISDHRERARHAEIVAERLEITDEGVTDAQADDGTPLATAARRLGVTVDTVRRRVRRGDLEGIYRGRRLVGVVMAPE